MNERPEFPGIEEEIPAGLAYKEAYWEAALTGIKAREAFLFRLKLAVGLGMVLLIGLGGSGWYYLKPADGQFAATKSLYGGTLNEDEWVRGLSDDTISFIDYAEDGSPLNNDQNSSVIESEQTDIQPDDQLLADNGSAVDQASDEQTSPDENVVEAGADVMAQTPSPEQGDISNPEQISDIGETADGDEVSSDVLASGTGREREIERGIEIETEREIAELAGNEISMQLAEEQPDITGSVTENVPPRTATAKDLIASSDGVGERVELFANFSRMSTVQLSDISSNQPMNSRPVGAIVEIRHHKILPPLKPFNVQVLMGTSLLTDYGSRKDDVVFNPIVGVAADYNMTRKFSFNTNVHYFSIKGTDRPFSSQSTTLDFVRKTTITSVATNKLHYVSLPVNMAYRLGQRTQVSAGVGVSILAQSENVVSVTEEVNGQTTLQEEFRQDGYVSGFNSVNTYVNLGLNYYISGNTTWGLTYQYGLSDVTRNDFYGNDGMDRNSRLSAYVRFNVF
jgi:hypothetical protein